MNFQGRLTNAQGQAINGAVQVTFNMYDSQAGGIPVWSETQTLTAQDGLFQVLLGSGVTPLDNTVFKFNTERWLGVQVASDPEMTPRMRIASVPYSFTAQQARRATDLVCLGCVLTGHLAVGAVGSGAIQDGGVQSQDVAFNYAASDAKAGKASDADKLDGLDSTAFALAGAAQTGSAADLLLYQRPLTVTTVDRGPTSVGIGDIPNNTGTHTSIAIGIDGLPIIAYQDSFDDLRVAHCNDPACASATFSELDSGGLTGTAGEYISIAIGQDGRPVIGYHKRSGLFQATGRLKLAFCEDIACNSAVIASVDTGSGSMGQFTSLSILPSGDPVISYYDGGPDDLKVAFCAGQYCSNPTTVAVDPLGNVGKYSSITLDGSQHPVISYYDETNRDLKFAHCGGTNSANPTIRTLESDGDMGQYTSIAIGGEGDPIISYHDASSLGDLSIIHCRDSLCSPGVTGLRGRLVDRSGVGQYSSISIGRMASRS